MTSYTSGNLSLIPYNQLELGSVFYLNTGLTEPTLFIKIHEGACCCVNSSANDIILDDDPFWRLLNEVYVVFVTKVHNELLIGLHNAFPPSRF